MPIHSEAEYTGYKNAIGGWSSLLGMATTLASLHPSYLPSAEETLSFIRGYLNDLQFEIDCYEQAKAGIIQPDDRISSIGRMVRELRIARGLETEGLAMMLGVDHTALDTAERNNYTFTDITTIQRVIDALNGDLQIHLLPRDFNHHSATADYGDATEVQ